MIVSEGHFETRTMDDFRKDFEEALVGEFDRLGIEFANRESNQSFLCLSYGHSLVDELAKAYRRFLLRYFKSAWDSGFVPVSSRQRQETAPLLRHYDIEGMNQDYYLYGSQDPEDLGLTDEDWTKIHSEEEEAQV